MMQVHTRCLVVPSGTTGGGWGEELTSLAPVHELERLVEDINPSRIHHARLFSWVPADRPHI